MADGDKLLPEMDFNNVKPQKGQQKLADVPAEDKLPVEDDFPVEDELPIEDEHKEGDSESSSDSSDESSSDSDSEAEFECTTCDKKFSGYTPFRQHQKGKNHAKAVARKKKEEKMKGKKAEDEDDAEFVLPEPFAICKICKKEFSGPESYHMHLKSKSHKQKVQEASVLQQVREEGDINVDKLRELYKSKKTAECAQAVAGARSWTLEDEKATDEFECKDCGKGFSGLMPFTQHLVSKSHAKKVEKIKKLSELLSEASETSKQKDLSTLSLEDDILVCKICTMSFSGPESAMMHLKSRNHSKSLDKYVRKLERKREKEEKKASSSHGKEPEDERDKSPDEDLQRSSGSSTEPHMVDGAITEGVSSPADKTDEGLDQYQKYKEYKKVMNSLRENDSLV